MIGRLAAPIFLFMVVEGYTHTRNRFNYAKRLLIGFWIMGVLNFLIPQLLPIGNMAVANNIFGTMFVSVLVMYGYDSFRQKKWLHGVVAFALPALTAAIILAALQTENPLIFSPLFILLPNYLTVEGGVLFVILTLSWYIFRKSRAIQMLLLAALALFLTGFWEPGFGYETLFVFDYQWMMVAAAIPLWFYNGQRGKGNKWFFYIFYPAHIYGLYIASYIYHQFFM